MRRVNRQTQVSGLERKIAMQINFSLTPESVRFLERNTRWPIRLGG
jgi:hypothetical protein